MTKRSRETEIIEAASRIVQQKGVFSLTLEAVAKEAGVSKGGLLYHFPTKEALVEGMVNHLISSYKKGITEQMEQDDVEIGKWTRSIIKETYRQTYHNEDMNTGLLAALAINPALLDTVRDRYQEWQEQLDSDGIDPVKALILRLSMDGLWLTELLGLVSFDEKTREEVKETLVEQTKYKDGYQ
ncbi:TetR/AcrR family transcriptional regulator [Texcoconibacillus texcoconensis]|uniref:AcrR family transcriptional regulator n=1 Tax=Texcoconibacillus texcoconensis TaxID=1095777 RepID=A0A840QLU6_9BACI|nr:TetR/AcrR family transcriptional regulator [Texcoconibacillus texcoconensis]MBB5172326.1 AcrR family transcriptional regulator [Texcoconibacillus texcoconensis]